MFRSFRSLIVVLEALSLLTPLLSRKGRGLKMAVLLKQLAILALTHSALIWKFLERRRWSPEAIKEFLNSMRSVK